MEKTTYRKEKTCLPLAGKMEAWEQPAGQLPETTPEMSILQYINTLKRFGKPYIDLLLTQDCLLCSADSDTILCPVCTAGLPHLSPLRCPRCALPTPNGETCGRCIAKPPHFDATRAAFRYDFPLDKLVQSFKYGHRLALGAFLGKQLASQAHDLEADMVIPLPLHPYRLRERGFNQALELAHPVSKTLRLPIDSTSCRRIRHTLPQADMPWKERTRNIRNAFHCETDFNGKRIILVDDVMTTGTSLDECARTLKLHGAAEVTLVVAARTLPKDL